MADSYLVLARKYRPKTFDEVAGQDVAKRVLRSAIAEGRLGHAYLLCGPRGTGKTTLARIVARSVNCEQGPTPEPCGVCERCEGLDRGREADVIEIDAASHTGVDSIRELRDEVAYAPLKARRKVYIIDEVHMLSKAAFNALLKTLEEPPPHVVFLFATTEPHKVLETILSRCQVLRLEALPVETITGRLDEVFSMEGIQAEAGVTAEIARGSRGGMRDALSKADELLALGGETPTLADLERLGAGGGAKQVGALLDAIEACDKPAVLGALAEMPGTPQERLGRLLGELRRAVLVGHLGTDAPQVDGTEAERASSMERAKRLGLRRIELMMQELLRARERARLLAGEEDVVLEVALLELADADNTLPLTELAARLEALASGAPLAPIESTPSQRPPSQRTPASGTRAPERPAPSASFEPEPSPAEIRSSGTVTPKAPPRAARTAGGPREWLKATVAKLKTSHRSLADVVEARASFSVTGDRGTLGFRGLSETESRLVADKRNQRRILGVLTDISGVATIEVDANAPAPPTSRARASQPGSQSSSVQPSESPTLSSEGPAAEVRPDDTLTNEVANLFEGMIEDI